MQHSMSGGFSDVASHSTSPQQINLPPPITLETPRLPPRQHLSEANRKAAESLFDENSPITSATQLEEIYTQIHIVWDADVLAKKLKEMRYISGEVVSRDIFMKLVEDWVEDNQIIPESSPLFLFTVMGGESDGSGSASLSLVKQFLRSFGMTDDALEHVVEDPSNSNEGNDESRSSFDVGYEQNEENPLRVYHLKVVNAMRMISQKTADRDDHLSFAEFALLLEGLEAPPPMDHYHRKRKMSEHVARQLLAIEKLREQMRLEKEQQELEETILSPDDEDSESENKDGRAESTLLTMEEAAMLAEMDDSGAPSRYLNNMGLYRVGSSLNQLRKMRTLIREYLLREKYNGQRSPPKFRSKRAEPRKTLIDRFNDTEAAWQQRKEELEEQSRLASPPHDDDVESERHGDEDREEGNSVAHMSVMPATVEAVAASPSRNKSSSIDEKLRCWTKSTAKSPSTKRKAK